LGIFLMLVFVTQLRSVLIEAGGGQRLFPNVAFGSGVLLVGGIIVAGSFQMVLIVASRNREYAVVHLANVYSQNNELLFLAGMVFVTLSSGLAMLLNRGPAPRPKLLGWYSLLVAVVGSAGLLSFLGFLFGFPIWIIATGLVVAVETRRGELGPTGGAAAMEEPAPSVAA
jgi:hypothetical protein